MQHIARPNYDLTIADLNLGRVTVPYDDPMFCPHFVTNENGVRVQKDCTC